MHCILCSDGGKKRCSSSNKWGTSLPSYTTLAQDVRILQDRRVACMQAGLRNPSVCLCVSHWQLQGIIFSFRAMQMEL